MTHMITASGAEYHLAGPGSLAHDARPVCIEDIAHHLSLINRFTGATKRPYSVAEHSLLCADIALRMKLSPALQLCMLMHDAHEAYTTDLSSPAKIAVNCYSMGAGGLEAWGMFEDEHAKTVRRHFGLLSAFAGYKAMIREIDLQALATERHFLTAYNAKANGPWEILGDGSHLPVPIAAWARLDCAWREEKTWKQWRQDFLERFHALRLETDDAFAARTTAARAVC
jgi:hypothetical protein